jgi:hypothetical protein
MREFGAFPMGQAAFRFAGFTGGPEASNLTASLRTIGSAARVCVRHSAALGGARIMREFRGVPNGTSRFPLRGVYRRPRSFEPHGHSADHWERRARVRARRAARRTRFMREFGTFPMGQAAFRFAGFTGGPEASNITATLRTIGSAARVCGGAARRSANALYARVRDVPNGTSRFPLRGVYRRPKTIAQARAAARRGAPLGGARFMRTFGTFPMGQAAFRFAGFTGGPEASNLTASLRTIGSAARVCARRGAAGRSDTPDAHGLPPAGPFGAKMGRAVRS